NIANSENGNANAIAKPNIPIAGARSDLPAASTSKVPMIMEALGIQNVKTQAEYEATFATQGTLGYILETVLKYVVAGLDTPVNFVLSLFANLAYTISKDGLTTIVGNLIAPVSALIKSLEGVLPVAIVIELKNIFADADAEGKKPSVLTFKMGDEVAANGYNVGLTLDLDGDTLEDLVATVIDKFAADLGLNIDLSFRDIAAGSAKVDANGAIIYTASSVSGEYDILHGTWGQNIQGDAADTIITLLDMILTTENINAVLKLVLKDKTLDETIDGLMGGKLAVLF
ncbi:MAG: hypothetical protein IIX06_00820, partial [Bacteroidales bacterium]|nr:hypothetical protein [Bacteroidales bacterium]